LLRRFSEIAAVLVIFIYNIYIIYKYVVFFGVFQNPPSRKMTLSFVTFVMLPRKKLLP